jgi:hypothetical protein
MDESSYRMAALLVLQPGSTREPFYSVKVSSSAFDSRILATLNRRPSSCAFWTVKNSARRPTAPNTIHLNCLLSEPWPSPDLYHILNAPQADLLNKHINTGIRHTVTLGSCFPSSLAAGVIEVRRQDRQAT